MPGVPAAPRWLPSCALGGLLLLLPWSGGGAAMVAGQSADPGVGEGRRVASVGGLEAGPALLKGSWAPVLRIRGHLQLTSSLRIGAEGVMPLGSVPTTPAGAPDEPELELGYGGFRADYHPERWPVSGSVLLAAGSARVRSSLLGTDLATRNILLVEPGVHLAVGEIGPLRYGVGLSARIPLGTPSLPGVRPRDFLGGTLSLTVEWARAP